MTKNNIQSVLISRRFTYRQALDFLIKHNFKHYKVDFTRNFMRFRQYNPKPNKRYITVKSSTSGIEYVIEY